MSNSQNQKLSKFDELKQKLETIQESESGVLTGGFTSIESTFGVFLNTTNRDTCNNNNDCSNSNNIGACSNAAGKCSGSDNGDCNNLMMMSF